MIKANELRKGRTIIHDGARSVVHEARHHQDALNVQVTRIAVGVLALQFVVRILWPIQVRTNATQPIAPGTLALAVLRVALLAPAVRAPRRLPWSAVHECHGAPSVPKMM